MENKHGETIEFQAMNDDSQITGQIRHSFRIPIKAPKNYFAVIDNFSYPIVDIAHGGVSFEIPHEPDLIVGQILAGCRLHLGNDIIDPPRSEVVHLSPGNGNTWICGIHWLGIENNRAKKIESLIQDFRKKLFTDKRT